MALFTPGPDALIFYRKLATFGHRHLRPEGHLFAEVHSERGQFVLDLFRREGYEAELKADLFGKERMVRATRPRSDH
jgi:release factor glutamine methyltransferase